MLRDASVDQQRDGAFSSLLRQSQLTQQRLLSYEEEETINSESSRDSRNGKSDMIDAGELRRAVALLDAEIIIVFFLPHGWQRHACHDRGYVITITWRWPG